ncbi:MAG: EVE domain-containing protein [Bryobacterales bacterium]|nr:EVE domain-containing protein [Bryobacterales bacterium]
MAKQKRNYFLAKTDPDTYSIADFEREGRTVWDGVKNPQALQAIRAMRPGDRVFIYHSMGEAAVLGVADAVSDPYPDPKHPDDPKRTVIDLQFVRRLDPPVTLREIKALGLFDDWSLVRQSRLSTMAAPAAFAEWMRERFPKAKI